MSDKDTPPLTGKDLARKPRGFPDKRESLIHAQAGLVETITGVLLMFYYRPTIEYAYNDIIALREHVPLGIMRELHRWGAHMMVLTVWLHMLRVFLTGSYKPPREFNWNIGVMLLLLGAQVFWKLRRGSIHSHVHAEEGAERLALGLAADVPQGDVDGADRSGRCAPGADVGHPAE